jgi:SAM-dependent methyltransferase
MACGTLAAAMAESQPPERPRASRKPSDFDALYTGTPPWDIGYPQPAFLELANSGELRGRLLDAGCGTGEHALMAAALGLHTTGVDTSVLAIESARRKARERSLPVRFLVWNALQLAALGEQFDTVLDSGLFHVLDDQDRRAYVENLTAVTAPGGRYFMLCFSDRQPGEGQFGPRRIREFEIRDAFAHGWRVDAIEPVKIEATVEPEGIFAWRAKITRADV